MEKYVWYACYGSNINQNRFNYYIKGGKYPENKSYYTGCRNKANFVDKKNIIINYSLYFSQKSKSWGNKAVAFITSQTNERKHKADKENSEYTSHTKCVLYKVTLDQFIDIFLQENSKEVNSFISKNINIELIKKGQQIVIGDNLEDWWYGRLLRLENYEDGCPVYTFTSKIPDDDIIFSEPSEKYLRVIGEGLIENFRLNKNDLINYLYNLKGIQNTNWTREKIGVLFKKYFYEKK